MTAADAQPPQRRDLVVVGGGIVGLAVARELLRRHPRLRVAILEREAAVGAHQTSHNSGVVHAGIYYKPGSLKARLCVAGTALLREYCAEHGIRYDACGKLIIALTPAEIPGLDELERRGRANGVAGLRRIDPRAIAEIEPHARGVAALHSPVTAIVDFPAVARSLAGDCEQRGAAIVTGCEVTGAERASGGGLIVRHRHGAIATRHAVFCAGGWADRLAVACGADPDPRIVPFRGAYLALRPERSRLVRGLIYPVPDPRLPFLGVHLTRHVDGRVLVGPTALLAGALDAYRLTRVRGRDLAATLTWPGSWRMFARWWRTGLREMGYAANRRAFLAAAARYVPELGPGDVEPGPTGVRAQAVGRDGTLLDDFLVSHTPDALHVRNAPSPAATSALALAELIADRSERELGVG